MDNIDYQQLARQLIDGVATKAVGSTPTASYGHGRGGIFSYPGLERPVFSALILPRQGLHSLLPVRTSPYDSPLYGIFTGVTASEGEEPSGVCDDPPTTGLSKMCTHTFVWGRQSRQTKVIQLDRVGQLINRSEFTDLQFLGGPWQNTTQATVPTVPGATGMNGVLNTEMGKALFELAVAWSRDFSEELYSGNPANNSAGGGRKYYYGLDMLINTGYRDAESGTACPAADSIVKSAAAFGTVNAAGSTYVSWITNIYRRLKHIASLAGLDPVTWVLTMREDLFYELTEVWPCAYATYRCNSAGTFDASQVQNVDTQWMIDMRDAMRTGQYLLVDGQQLPVAIDDAIAETTTDGATFSSTIYFVPLSVLGGTPVTYLETFNMDMPGGPMDAARIMAPDGSYYTSDGGRFLWHRKPPTNMCVQLLALTVPRILLLTPHLAARLTNVTYTPLAHLRDWDPDASFYADGGRTSRDVFLPSFYSPTS